MYVVKLNTMLLNACFELVDKITKNDLKESYG